jgi:transcriptional regulator with XRE-family HTH domain
MGDNHTMPADDATLLAVANLSDLGQRLRTCRRASGLTQDDVAGSDISPTYVSRIEAGQRRPDLRVARLIAERLGTSIEFLASGVEPADADEARLALRYAELALRSGEAGDAVAQLTALRDSGAELGPLRDDATWLLGQALEMSGRLDEAAVLLETLVRSEGSPRALQAAIALCRCYREAGDLARSIDVGERARARAEELGLAGTDDEIRLAVTLVAAYYERGDVVYAAQLCQQALDRAEGVASVAGRAAAYWNGSVIAADRGRQAEAVVLAERALALLADTDDSRALARLRVQLGAVLLGQDPPDCESAERHLTQAREALALAASPVEVARCDVALADAALLSGDPATAELRAQAALAAAQSLAPFLVAEAQAVLGRVALAHGDSGQAQTRFRQAVAALTGVAADRDAAQLWYQLGELLAATGDDRGARDAFRSAGASVGLRPVPVAPTSVSPDPLAART